MKICDRYEVCKDIRDLTKQQRTVLLIWSAKGYIDNGGFAYLLEVSPSGDETYAQTREAFNEICPEAYRLFQEVFNVFPDRIPPLDIQERLWMYHQLDESIREKYDEKFYELDNILVHRLYRYIKRNIDNF